MKPDKEEDKESAEDGPRHIPCHDLIEVYTVYERREDASSNVRVPAFTTLRHFSQRELKTSCNLLLLHLIVVNTLITPITLLDGTS